MQQITSWLCLLLIFGVACTNTGDASKAHISAILQENQILHDVNDNLRTQLIAAKENASQNQFLANEYLKLRLNSTPAFAPTAHIPLSDILVSSDKVVIRVPDLQHGIIAATKSMEPVLDENDVVLEMVPTSSADIHVGDIIIYQKDEYRIVHRVIRIDQDWAGWYAIVKGDSNPREDPEKVRYDQVQGVVVGVIY